MIINPTIKLIVPTSTSFKAFASGISLRYKQTSSLQLQSLKQKGRMTTKKLEQIKNLKVHLEFLQGQNIDHTSLL